MKSLNKLIFALLLGVGIASCKDKELNAKTDTLQEGVIEMTGNLSELSKLKGKKVYEDLKIKALAAKQAADEALEKAKDKTSETSHKAVEATTAKVNSINAKIKKALEDSKKSEEPDAK